MRVNQWFRRIAFILPLIALCCLPLAGCDDNAAPPLPTKIEIVTGDMQYSKRATELPIPLRVRIRYDNGDPAPGFDVRFKPSSGTVSASTDRTNDGGLAVTNMTLPDATGDITIRASLSMDASVFVDFTATSSEYYCPQEDLTFSRDFSSQGDLFLFTNKSALHAEAGVVKIQWGSGLFIATDALEFPVTSSPVVPWDAAISVAGDFFLARTWQVDDILQINSNFSYNPDVGFATLDAYLGTEITMAPAGILVGCDEFGPFAVGCRDTLARFEDAMYPDLGLVANNDAVAVDPLSDDIYYIVSEPTGTNGALMRLPMTGLVATGPPEVFASLTPDEALGANGMQVDDADGSVFILVDTDATKSIVKVSPAKVKSTVYNFFDRGPNPEDAGVQNDLAIDQRFSLLFTVDVLNGTLLTYTIPVGQMAEQFPNVAGGTDPEALSKMSTAGQERVGLVVLP